MSAPIDEFEEIDGLRRYAPPQYRRPEDQACVDMIRRMRIAAEREREVMHSDASEGGNTRPVSATPANQLKFASPLDIIADQIRTMPYGDLVAMAEGTGADAGTLWSWANK